MPIKIAIPARENVKRLIATFGCIRSSSLTAYLRDIMEVNSPKWLADGVISETSAIRKSYHNKKVVKCVSAMDVNYTSVDAFDGYLALLRDHLFYKDDLDAKLVKVNVSDYPYDYVAAIGDTIYMITVFDHRGFQRIEYHNLSIRKRIERAVPKGVNLCLTLVVPAAVEASRLEGLIIVGDYRLILLKEGEKEVQSIVGELIHGKD